MPNVDLLLTDPPYGIGHSPERYRDAKNGGAYFSSKKWPTPSRPPVEAITWDVSPVEEWLIAAIRAKASVQIIWGGNYYSLPQSARWLVWDKEIVGYFTPVELAWTNLSGGPRLKRHLWHGFARARNEARSHPTQKPIDLMSWCITEAGNVHTLLDPFMGSGTTLRAAKDCGLRHAIGIEIEERYCEIAAKRMAQEVLPFTNGHNNHDAQLELHLGS